jgi:hypothetical protein
VLLRRQPPEGLQAVLQVRAQGSARRFGLPLPDGLEDCRMLRFQPRRDGVPARMAFRARPLLSGDVTGLAHDCRRFSRGGYRSAEAQSVAVGATIGGRYLLPGYCRR